MNLRCSVAMVIMLSFCQFANAGTKIFGFELGVTTPEQVIKAYTLPDGYQLMHVAGINKYSNGSDLRPRGDYKMFAVKDLKLPEPDDVYIENYVFDEKDKLVYVALSFGVIADKTAIFKAIASKYKLVSNAGGLAIYKSADATITVSQGGVAYWRTDLHEKYTALQAAEKRKSTAGF